MSIKTSSQQEVTSVQFTIGKIDAGLAVLLSTDHHLEGVGAGSIVNITVERNRDEERRQAEDFASLQEEIYSTYSRKPIVPIISVKSITQTSIIIRWDPLVLHAATFRGMDVFRNGQRLNVNLNQFASTVKLSGLDVGHDYEIWIVLRTTAGSFESNRLRVTTHTMDNLTGLNPSFGTFATDSEVEQLMELLRRIGASYTDDLTSENTHLVCSIARGPKYEKALELNIPVVSPEFLKACEQQRRVMPAHSFYLSRQ